MELLRCLFLILVFSCVSLTEPVHSKGHEQDAFHSIINTLGLNETLQLEDVNSILTQLEILDCSNSTNKVRIVTYGKLVTCIPTNESVYFCYNKIVFITV